MWRRALVIFLAPVFFQILNTLFYIGQVTNQRQGTQMGGQVIRW